MSRKPIIAANWKMNKTPEEAVNFVTAFKALLGDRHQVDAVIAPTFLSIPAASEALGGVSNIGLGAQNMHPEESGAFTGEINAAMLKAAGVGYVIIGHSERRALFGETDAFINQKLHALLANDFIPIVCIGETLEERDAGRIEEVLHTQLTGSLAGISKEQAAGTVVAYEPVWAIGTGRTATPEQAQEAHAYVRKVLGEMFGEDAAAAIRIQYGGSVKPENTLELISQTDVDGALVGGASLEPGSFHGIITAAEEYVG